MDTASQPDSSETREAAAAAVTPDPLTAALLAKHSAGERLSPREYGKLGAFAKRVKGWLGATGPAPAPAPAPVESGTLARVVPVAGLPAPVDSLDNPPFDPGIVKRTTAAILGSGNTFACRLVTREARKAGADQAQMDRFARSASLPEDTKALMVDVSPDVLAAMGIDPSNYPLAVFFGGLGLWASNVWLCVDELRAMQKERNGHKDTKPAPAAAVPVPALAPGTALPDPPQPPGSPPVTFAK